MARKPVSNARRAGRGITLVELLVVMAIVGLLVAMLMPALHRVWGTANLASCASNLNRLGQAFGVRRGEEVAGAVSILNTTGWPGQILPYIDQSVGVLVCPEGGATLAAAVDVASELEFKTVTGGGAVYYTSMAEGRWVVKFSCTQFYDAKSKGLLNDNASADGLRGKYDCAYQPDGNPTVYWLCYEDYGNDEDYKDVMVRVTTRKDGSVELLFTAGNTGHQSYCYSKTKGEVLMMIPKNTSEAAGVKLALQGQGAETSYGLNLAVDLHRKGHQILMMDYAVYLAQSTDLWGDEEMDPDGDGVPVFARHASRVNVLFTDGRVEVFQPHEVDPILPSTAALYWDQ